MGQDRGTCNLLDKIGEMATKEISAIRNISEITFKDFFKSRIVRTQAKTAPRYAAKVITKSAMIPLYYLAFKLYQFGDATSLSEAYEP